ncbi:MAG: isochorismate synthase [bacterium]|nr:isochorismate synthase [bacterium]
MRDVLTDFLSARTRDAFYWQQPSHDFSILGVGRAAVIETSGCDRFAQAAARSRDLFDDLELYDLDTSSSSGCIDSVADSRGPLLMGGFAFYDGEIEPSSEWYGLGAGRLILPEVVTVCRAASAWVTRTCCVDARDREGELLDRFCAQLPDGAGPRGSTRAPGGNASDITSEFAQTAGLAGEVFACGPEIRVQADRTHGQYAAQVARAVEAIEAGKFEKVVLARSLRVAADSDFDLSSFLATLRSVYPRCATLAVREGDDLFVSASPERLVALDGDEVVTAAVAGSAPRGRSPEEEEQCSARLSESKKDRVEHEVVKRAIREALGELCGTLAGPLEPRLLKLEGIQHLETPLRGQLQPPWCGTANVLDLVARLHPTPAVGGAPRCAALDWLEHFEALDRGWYAGPVGYLDAGGNGEFRVALRSALLRDRSARLYAGAGIVAGSDPLSELAETRLKLRALLAPLTEI